MTRKCKPGTLYVTGTPIGNLQDMTSRMRQVLSSVGLVAAEDTRRTRNLLSHLGISVKLASCHKHNEAASSLRIVAALEDGMDVALVSDAGMPGLSDPGSRTVSMAHERGIPVVPVPGPSAVTAALAVCGMDADRFHFEGFLPSKTSARRKRLQALAGVECLMVFFEAPHRLEASLKDMLGCLGDRKIFMARELTKLHETLVSTTIADLVEQITALPVKGEITLVVQGAGGNRPPVLPDGGREDVLGLLRAFYSGGRVSMKRVSSLLSSISGLPASEIYSMAIKARDGGQDKA